MEERKRSTLTIEDQILTTRKKIMLLRTFNNHHNENRFKQESMLKLVDKSLMRQVEESERHHEGMTYHQQ